MICVPRGKSLKRYNTSNVVCVCVCVCVCVGVGVGGWCPAREVLDQDLLNERTIRGKGLVWLPLNFMNPDTRGGEHTHTLAG